MRKPESARIIISLYEKQVCLQCECLCHVHVSYYRIRLAGSSNQSQLNVSSLIFKQVFGTLGLVAVRLGFKIFTQCGYIFN
jgi:hypothetical protein